MDNLNHENFFNQAKKDYPMAMERFCKFIDDYKEEVGWNKLFGEHVKFHDLPIDMQNGIISRFDLITFGGPQDLNYNFVMSKLPLQFSALLADYEQFLNRMFDGQKIDPIENDEYPKYQKTKTMMENFVDELKFAAPRRGGHAIMHGQRDVWGGPQPHRTPPAQLDELGFVFCGNDGRYYWCRMWYEQPWMMYRHADKQWVTLKPMGQMDVWAAKMQEVSPSLAQKLHDEDPAQCYNELKKIIQFNKNIAKKLDKITDQRADGSSVGHSASTMIDRIDSTKSYTSESANLIIVKGLRWVEAMNKLTSTEDYAYRVAWNHTTTNYRVWVEQFDTVSEDPPHVPVKKKLFMCNHQGGEWPAPYITTHDDQTTKDWIVVKKK